MRHSRLRHYSDAGIMGKLVSQFDWISTSLGDPDHWPSNLLNLVGIILESRIPMFISWGKDQIIIYNDSAIPLLGKQHPRALGEKITTVWPEVSRIIQAFFIEGHNGKSIHIEDLPFTVEKSTGPQKHFFTISFQPIRLENESLGGIFGTALDTTEEVLRRRALEESKSFRNYQEMSPFPFFSITKDWIVDYINPASLLTARRTKDQVVGKLFWEAFEGISYPDSIFIKQNQRAMDGETVIFEGYHEPYDTWYHVFSYPLHPGVGVIYQDITESKKLQIELGAAVEARDRFLSFASHELKTPLTSLKLHTQMMRRNLQDELKNEKLKKFFDQTDMQISRLSSLVGDMLDVSRISEGKLALNFSNEDLKQLVTDFVERFSAYYLNSAVTPPHLSFIGQDFHCELDSNRFEQVVSNLLMNALKYGEGEDVNINVCAEDEKIVLIVEDHGSGIPESDLQLIFGQFYRSQNSPGEGLGLGLFITQQIVVAHGGKISVASTLGEGTTFRVELPKKRNL